MGLLDGKKLLVTGVLTDGSIAFHVARLAQQEGAEVLLTSFGRQFRLTQAISRRLPKRGAGPRSSTSPTPTTSRRSRTGCARHGFDSLDGVVHSIGFAPQSVMGGNFLAGEWDDVATALQVSAYSLKSLAVATQPLLSRGRRDRRPHVRRALRVAGLRLDGCRQGRLRVDRRATWPATSARTASA